MNNTNCVNCGAPIEHGKCRYCGTSNTSKNNYGKTSSNTPVDLSSKTRAMIIGAFSLFAPFFYFFKK